MRSAFPQMFVLMGQADPAAVNTASVYGYCLREREMLLNKAASLSPESPELKFQSAALLGCMIYREMRRAARETIELNKQ